MSRQEISKEIIKTQTTVVVTCDRCAAVGPPTEYCKCYLCDRDLCKYKGCSIRDPEDTWDYPDHMCPQCWEIGKPYLERIKGVQSLADRQEEEIRQEWKKACR